MACVALTSLIETIEIEFLGQTARVSLSLHDHDRAEIKSFLVNLSTLQALLQMESSGDGDGDALKLRDLEMEIREFALKAEDDIELQLSNFILLGGEYGEKAAGCHELLHQTLQEAAKKATDLLESLKLGSASVALTILIKKIDHYFWQHFPTVYGCDGTAMTMSYFSHKLSTLRGCLMQERNSNNSGAAIKILETKIMNFALKTEDDLQIQQKNFLLAKHTVHQEKASQKLTLHGFLKPEGRMVGRHHDCTVIKKQLFSGGSGLINIISIVGMVGIGKTTVARNVYEDPSVASYFDVRGWVTIPPPQHYNKSRMLSQLLQSITPVEVIKKGSTPHELEMQVRKCFGGKKYLIVLDNITSKQTWYQAWNEILGCVSNGLVGSYILLTTRHYFNLDVQRKRYIHIHKMTLLDQKESWELFCNILSIDEEHLAPKFEKIRNHVVEKCDGLPQLIVEVAKRLSKCNNIQQGWKKIEKELESLGLLDRNALSVSYNMLPHHLKVCFLYFGVFPKRKKIFVKMLIRLWIAEGFVKPLKRKELEDQVYDYLQELTDRSLLLIEDRSCNGKIKTCRMHSALHSFCVGEAQKGGILCAVNTQQHSGLSLNAFTNSCRWLSSYSHSFDYYVLFGTNIPRSIFFFLENHEMFVPPKLLRVLAFDTSISLQRVPVQLGGLVFLRYLSITQWFEDLDHVVSNNPNLETLVVSGNGAPTVHLPSSIWKPPNLRHLELGNSYMVDPPSVDKKNLQTLSWVVRPIHCRQKVYSKFPNIKNLKIFLKDDIDPSHIGGCCSNPIILDHFDYLEGLEKLSISDSIGLNAALPEECMYPSGLKKLKLSGTNISEGDLNVIAKLPQLEVLKLENAFHGAVWNSLSKGGFPVLIFFLLEAKELKQWVVGQEHFRMLRHLVLRSCNCLEQIPECFERIPLLESIGLEGCHSFLVASSKQLQQKRRFKDVKDQNPWPRI
ncbi:PREDICTED: putative late blight resistance protein homolog R1A-4 isoform X2 [Ipomoea nil]|uniref:putative late blight resistance protein homolog R1A-4 isoform X2 n=1 Tax=Ipomoea nil TaxID=35883 RepID=UPI000901CF08|nr:PREDICTED: putative late blight resistance protein homolog R1A-4 isoform X2 [Ipomoea nil]